MCVCRLDGLRGCVCVCRLDGLRGCVFDDLLPTVGVSICQDICIYV